MKCQELSVLFSQSLEYVIAAINYIIVSFGYKAHWDCLSYAKVGGKYCIHLFLEEIDL